MGKALVSMSKLLSLVLRHKPDEIGIALDAEGWVDVNVLLNRLNAIGRSIDRTLLEEIVATSDKQRFALSADSRRIRANQGHSVAVDLALSTVEPPDVLYHGTALSSLASIQTSGLLPGNRHDVHLSADSTTARTVGSRHGKPVVLKVNAKKMRADGHLFRVSENGVWLALMVPPTYLEIWTEGG